MYKPTGSKDRLFEMMQKVNRISLNEDFNQPQENGGSESILNATFEQLVDGTIKVQQSNTQTEENESYLEVKCLDTNNNNATFVFKINASVGDQDGVFNIDSASLVDFEYKNARTNQMIVMNESELGQFNNEHTNEILNIASDNADFETGESEIDEEYANAIKKIDSYPFGGGSTRMQTGKAYADQKPNNPKLRVNAPELDKYVDESNDFSGEIDYYKKLPDDTRTYFILNAREILDDRLADKGIDPQSIPRSLYIEQIRVIANELYEDQLIKLNEDEDYPDQIGTNFKPKPQFPSHKKKRKKTVNINEYDNPEINNSDELERQELDNFQDIESEEEPNDGMSFDQESDEIDDLAKEKEMDGEELIGGLGDNKSPLEFDPDQVVKGMSVEMEHSSDPMVALEIVLDHLSEDNSYYTVKDTPEDSAQFNAASDAENDAVMTDVLLGYEPINVGDYESDGDDEHEDHESDEEEHEEHESPEEEHEEHETPEEEEEEDDEEDEEDEEETSDEDDEKKEKNFKGLNENWNRLETARKVLKSSDTKANTMGMSKKEAVQILIKNNLRG